MLNSSIDLTLFPLMMSLTVVSSELLKIDALDKAPVYVLGRKLINRRSSSAILNNFSPENYYLEKLEAEN